MNDNLLFEEKEELKRIRDLDHKKSINDLNKKNLSDEDLDEIFCEM